MAPLSAKTAAKVQSNLFARSKFWVPVQQRHPRANLLSYFFKNTDPYSSYALVQTLQIDLDNAPHVLLDPSVNNGKSIFLAVPFVVTPQSCDDRHNNYGEKVEEKQQEEDEERKQKLSGAAATVSSDGAVSSSSSSSYGSGSGDTMHVGLSSALIDIITSMHMGEQHMPNVTMHVTMNLNVKTLDTRAATVGTRLVALSQIDRMNKKVIFSQLKIIKDPSDAAIDKWIRDNHSATSSSSDSSVVSASSSSSPSPPLPLQFPDVKSIRDFIHQSVEGDNDEEEPDVDENEGKVKEAAITTIAQGQHVKMFIDVPWTKYVPNIVIDTFSAYVRWRG